MSSSSSRRYSDVVHQRSSSSFDEPSSKRSSQNQNESSFSKMSKPSDRFSAPPSAPRAYSSNPTKSPLLNQSPFSSQPQPDYNTKTQNNSLPPSLPSASRIASLLENHPNADTSKYENSANYNPNNSNNTSLSNMPPNMPSKARYADSPMEITSDSMPHNQQPIPTNNSTNEGSFLTNIFSHFVIQCPCCNNQIDLNTANIQLKTNSQSSQLNAETFAHNNSTNSVSFSQPAHNSNYPPSANQQVQNQSEVMPPNLRRNFDNRSHSIDYDAQNQAPMQFPDQNQSNAPYDPHMMPGPMEFSSLYSKSMQSNSQVPSNQQFDKSSVYQPSNSGPETPCVVMVHNIHGNKINCDMLYKLFSLYANINKIKFLKSFEQTAKLTAMIELSSTEGADNVIKYLDQLSVFGQAFHIQKSHKNIIEIKGKPYPLPDGTDSHKDFSSHFESKKFSKNRGSVRLNEPRNTVHISFLPPTFKTEHVLDILNKVHASQPQRVKIIGKPDKRSALIEFDNISLAAESIMLGNLAEMSQLKLPPATMRCLRMDFASSNIHE